MVTSSEQQYIDLYEQARQMICDHAPAVMNAVRDEAFRQFKANGFPSRKVERYKYTDLQKLFSPNYGLNLNRLNIPVDPYQAFSCDVPNLSTCLYFMVNDQFYHRREGQEVRGENYCDEGQEVRGERMVQPRLPEGVIIGSMAELFSHPSPFTSHPSSHPSPLTSHLAKYYNRLAGQSDDAVTQLNTMLTQDGLLVYVPRNVKVDRAIQVINIMRSDVDLMVNRRVLIVLEEGAQLKMLFCDHTADDRNFLTTQVIEAFVGEGAQLELYCLEETHNKNVRVSNVYIDQQRNSHVAHNVITLHNGTTRNRLDLHLNGEGAECECLGCIIADKQQHVDNNTLIIHHTSHCTSHELYKYVLDDHATGAFAGRVLVEPGAQKTVSQMTNQNLCASREARMYTQPMLEIYADDVKCAHGSTVGQLNDAALFYMRQRGISEQEARTLLQVAFINEVIDKIELVPLRDRLHHLVEKRFRGELNKCEGCRLCR